MFLYGQPIQRESKIDVTRERRRGDPGQTSVMTLARDQSQTALYASRPELARRQGSSKVIFFFIPFKSINANY